MKGRMAAWGKVLEGLDEALALIALRELGAFAALRQGPLSAADLGEQLNVVPRRLRSLLDVACIAGFLRRAEGARFALMPGDEALFDPDGPYDRQLVHGRLADIFGGRAQILETVRTGTPVDAAGPGGKADADGRRRFVLFLHARSQAVAAEVADLLALLGPVGRFADVGSGAGTYAHAVLRRFPDARAVLVDRPNAADTVAELADHEGLSDRIEFCPVDLTAAGDYGRGFDAILMSNLVHCHGEAACRHMVHQAAERLVAGGRLLVKDIDTADDRSGPAGALRFGLTMARLSHGGDVYPASEVAAWCADAGLTLERVFGLRESPTQYLLVARKP